MADDSGNTGLGLIGTIFARARLIALRGGIHKCIRPFSSSLSKTTPKLFKDHPHLGVRGATIELVEMLSPPGQ